MKLFPTYYDEPIRSTMAIVDHIRRWVFQNTYSVYEAEIYRELQRLGIM